MKMAATGSEVKSTSGLGQASQLLTPEEAVCPVCKDVLLEPVTLPCSHSVCLPCFKSSSLSPVCPLCGLRVSREDRLVNTQLWDLVRKSYPERCKRRMEQRDRKTTGEELFCSPTQISKAGEIRPEYGKQKFHGVLSDSENEEPIGKRTRNVSAFVRKTKTSPAFTKHGFQNTVRRSQSCTDPEEWRGRGRAPMHLPILDKGNIAHSYNAGILLSSENSRSLSAPIIVQDKRQSCRGVMASSMPFMAPQSKPERSISPESNDSISEELNHFKPIVCSPCTPPKRLPDGRVIEPAIVKSTPRNLTRSLQRPTSYEASPSILQKWKQIEVDRQCAKVTSKGTVTSPVSQDLLLKHCPVEERESKPCSCSSAKRKEHLGLCTIKTDAFRQEGERMFMSSKQRLIFDQPTEEPALNHKQPIQFCIPAAPHTSEGPATECGLFLETVVTPESHCGPTSIVKKQTPRDRNAGRLNSNDSQDHRKEANSRRCAQNQATSRKGKRRQKTKHLEETESRLKRSRPQSQDGFNIEGDRYIQQVQQEREDRQLALNLQRQFDMEQLRVDKQKTSPDKYFLRSWVSSENRTEINPRRSGRISKFKEHFHCNY